MKIMMITCIYCHASEFNQKKIKTTIMYIKGIEKQSQKQKKKSLKQFFFNLIP